MNTIHTYISRRNVSKVLRMLNQVTYKWMVVLCVFELQHCSEREKPKNVNTRIQHVESDNTDLQQKNKSFVNDNSYKHVNLWIYLSQLQWTKTNHFVLLCSLKQCGTSFFTTQYSSIGVKLVPTREISTVRQLAFKCGLEPSGPYLLERIPVSTCWSESRFL